MKNFFKFNSIDFWLLFGMLCQYPMVLTSPMNPGGCLMAGLSVGMTVSLKYLIYGDE